MRAAIVGLNWSLRTHLPILRELGWSVVGLVGRNRARTLEAAAAQNVPRGVLELAELASDGPFDLVTIAVPWDAHLFRLREALSFAASVLIEHPISPVCAESRRLLEDGHRAEIFVNFPGRFLEPVQWLKQRIEQFDGATDIDHRFYIPEDEELEWFNILMSHSLDIARHLLGDLTLVDASASGVDWVEVDQWPSWSWPAIATIDQDWAVVASSLSLEFRHRRGVYRLAMVRQPSPGFVERVDARLCRQRFAYETSLIRDDETSPWKASDLWEGAAEDLASVTYSDNSSDAWYVAQVEQMRAIEAKLAGAHVQIAPATGVDALAVQQLIVQSLAQLAALHPRDRDEKRPMVPVG